MKTLLMRTIQNGKMKLKGEIIETNDLPVKAFIKPHYTFIVDQVKFSMSDVERKLGKNEPAGICEYCVYKEPLLLSCKCFKVYYCSSKCKYSD
jgi:hypothetical protein